MAEAASEVAVSKQPHKPEVGKMVRRESCRSPGGSVRAWGLAVPLLLRQAGQKCRQGKPRGE